MGKLEILHQIKKLFLVNFPVVAGGFALLAATGATQAVVGAAAPALSTSFVGGAAALLGRLYYIYVYFMNIYRVIYDFQRLTKS